MYAKLESVYTSTGGRVVVDYAFLIKSDGDVVLPTEQGKQATSLRQSAEWGMRAPQAAFPRLKDRFLYEKNGERKCVLYSLVHLFNLRSKLVGLNQICRCSTRYALSDSLITSSLNRASHLLHVLGNSCQHCHHQLHHLLMAALTLFTAGALLLSLLLATGPLRLPALAPFLTSHTLFLATSAFLLLRLEQLELDQRCDVVVPDGPVG